MFYKYDVILEKCESGNNWLKDDRAAEVVKNKLHAYDKKRYDLMSYCIMSNHVHLLIKQYPQDSKKINGSGPSRNYALTETLRFIKGGSAREINMVLKRSGEFWQRESYDHYVRDRQELSSIIEYIEQNPVKAKLVKEAKDWKWSYTCPDFSEIELPFA